MSLRDLTSADQMVIKNCLYAIAQGPFLAEFEFQTRLGFQREDVNTLIRLWPNINDSKDDSDETIIINNCLNEICYGLDFSVSDWNNWFAVSRGRIEGVYNDWCVKRGWNSTGIK